jgi:hypothetical protein
VSETTSSDVLPLEYSRLPLPASRGVALKVALVVLLTAAMVVLVSRHTQGVNGPEYWNWSWRRLGIFPLYATTLAALAPLIAGVILAERNRIGHRAALALFMLTTLGMELAAISAQPPYGFQRLIDIVRNPVNTSYYTTATFVKDVPVFGHDSWLYLFPGLLADEFSIMVHARFKPPGLMLFYYTLIQLFGDTPRAALVGGLLIALLATLVVPATYRLIHFFGNDEHAALSGAAFIALSPSLILFLPQFDQLYPALACVMLIAWAKALQRGGYRWSLAFGGLLALGLFLSYIFLIFGLFLAVLCILHMGERGRRGVSRVIVQSILAIATVGLLYFFVAVMTGFDPIATFRVASALQESDLVHLGRPFPRHIPFDLLDFALGSGWISFLLIGLYLAREGGRSIRLFAHDPEHRLVFLAVLQILVVACAALLPGETARLYLPMLPLLMAPIGFELSRWPLRARLTVYVCLWLVTVVICQNMTFLYMGPELDGPRS